VNRIGDLTVERPPFREYSIPRTACDPAGILAIGTDTSDLLFALLLVSDMILSQQFAA
jgi:hypothetical protein